MVNTEHVRSKNVERFSGNVEAVWTPKFSVESIRAFSLPRPTPSWLRLGLFCVSGNVKKPSAVHRTESGPFPVAEVRHRELCHAHNVESRYPV